MNNIGPTDNEFINYIAWCEANGIEPFPEKEDIENYEEIEDIDEE